MTPENVNNISLSDVKWSSSNVKVATVDKDGNVRAVAPGTAKILTELSGKTASCDVSIRRSGGSSGGNGSSGGSSGGGSSSGGSSGGPSGGGSSTTVNTSNTWSNDGNGWKYKKEDNSWAANGWYQLNYNGILEWYYFNAQGYMVSGWLDDQGRRYYLNPVSDGTQGKMLTGWQQIDGKWYYFNEVSDGTRGALMTNTQIGEYYVNEQGVWVE